MSTVRALCKRVPAPAVDILLVAAAAVDVSLNWWDDTRFGFTLAVLGCAALVFRRHFPLTVFLLVLPTSFTQDVSVALLIALFTLAERSRNRRLLALCVALTAFTSSISWAVESVTQVERTIGLVVFVYSLATAAAPVLFGQLVQARRDLARRLDEIEDAREHERILHAQSVVSSERTQLAREMHDVVSHQVSLIAIQAGALQVSAQDTDTKDAARTIRALSVTTLDELRAMVTLLRASDFSNAELTPQPTLVDLHRLVESSGTHSDMTGELPSNLGIPAQRAIYRTVQEALTNVRKHAPGARADVTLWHVGHTVGVTVLNTPATRPSLALPGTGHGLVGLRERADILNGSLDAGPTTEGGYRVELRIPLDSD